MPESRCGGLCFGTWFRGIEALGCEPIRPQAFHPPLSRELGHASPGTAMTTRPRVNGVESKVLGVIEGAI
ncbi:MAG: hypothetical protein QXI12_00385 [Candidatus Methanomethyliaceae archaeon]